MANVNAPFGLRPVRYLNNSPWNGQARMYCVPSTDSTNAYAIGDPVMIAGSADSNGIPTIVLATPGSGLLGAIVGYGGAIYGGPGATPGALETTVIPAAKAKNYYVLVADDPNIIFETQEINTGTAFTAAEVGLNCNMVAAANSGYLSGWVLNNATEAVTATLDVKLLNLTQRVGNAFGLSSKWDVLINNHYYRVGSLGIS